MRSRAGRAAGEIGSGVGKMSVPFDGDGVAEGV